MPSKYVVVQAGDLTRGEHINVAVLAWDFPGTHFTDVPPDNTIVHVRVLQNWGRALAAFPFLSHTRDDITSRLNGIQTYRDLEEVRRRLGPYSPFDLTEERASTGSSEDLAEGMALHFLVEPISNKS